MTVSVQAVLDYLTTLNPSGHLCREEGVLFGRGDGSTPDVLVTWMATVAAISNAISEGCGIIVCHEALTLHDYFANASSLQPWTADRARLALLSEHDITVIRAHSTVDPTHVVPAFWLAIGLLRPLKQGNVWSFHVEKPIRLQDLAKRASVGLGMQGLRVTGDLDRQVRRIGTMVGGLGLDRHLLSWEQHLMPLRVEAIIAGETNDFAQRFSIDSGIALIETAHSASEEPGLRALAQDIRAAFPSAKVVFHKEVVPWAIV
jgi:putative NIF3 family GTP cyclohydrolase 1 type 2